MAETRSANAVLRNRFSRPQRRDTQDPSQALPFRTTLAAVSLLTIGVGFAITGAVVSSTSGISEAIPYLSMSGICLIPGAYSSTILARAYLGHHGFRYNSLPSYDE